MVDEEKWATGFLGRYAGFVTRLAAFVVDRAILAIITLCSVGAIQWALGAFRVNEMLGIGPMSWQAATSLGVGVYVVASVTYNIGLWMLVGQTLGKLLMGVRVVRTDGQRLRIGNAIRRELGYLVSAILFLGYLWVLFDNRRQGFHDKLAGTIVVYSWPEGLMRGTLVRDRVQRFVQERHAAQKEKSGT